LLRFSKSSSQLRLLPVKISAIISDYDGTLCPTASISSENNTVPPDLQSILHGISTKIPVCIISSKDLKFLRDKTQFAQIVSSIMGMETTQLMLLPTKDKHLSNKFGNVIIGYKLLDPVSLSSNSKFLAEIANKVKKEFQGISIGYKFTYLDHILAGISIDYRHFQKWEQYKTSVEPELKKTIERFMDSSRHSNLFMQTYSDHPFIDVFAIKSDKGRAFKAVSRLLNIEDSRKILYLGDSEYVNPVFRIAGLSVGIRSDRRINTKLDSDYMLEFNELRPFLQKLEKEDFIFDRMAQNLI
jgi:hydroxymethylpyrimidine pyrophosphatase-like HAD family hydrolase